MGQPQEKPTTKETYMLSDRKTLIEKSKTLIEGKETKIDMADQRTELGWPGSNQPHSWELTTYTGNYDFKRG